MKLPRHSRLLAGEIALAEALVVVEPALQAAVDEDL